MYDGRGSNFGTFPGKLKGLYLGKKTYHDIHVLS